MRLPYALLQPPTPAPSHRIIPNHTLCRLSQLAKGAALHIMERMVIATSFFFFFFLYKYNCCKFLWLPYYIYDNCTPNLRELRKFYEGPLQGHYDTICVCMCVCVFVFSTNICMRHIIIIIVISFGIILIPVRTAIYGKIEYVLGIPELSTLSSDSGARARETLVYEK